MLSPRKSIKKDNLKCIFSSANITSENKSDQLKIKDDKPVKKGNRCCICNIKVGLLGFQCKCDKTKLFCSSHRYATDHNCDFDYKADAKKLLEINNPKIIPDKMDKL